MWKRHRLLSSVKILIDPDLEFLHVFLHGDGWLQQTISTQLFDEKTIQECRGIGREVHSVAMPALLCHKEPARASKANAETQRVFARSSLDAGSLWHKG